MRRLAASFIALFLVAGSVHAQRSAQRIEEACFRTIGGIEQLGLMTRSQRILHRNGQDNW
jgi:hypothetical protein